MKVREEFQLNEIDVDRIINMAWEDRTPFEAILVQFKIKEADVIRLMKQEMTLKNWQKWRARVQGRRTKHAKLRNGEGIDTFWTHRCDLQKNITRHKISKKKY
jgi:uncharacterized protein (TIGR03643 family)